MTRRPRRNHSPAFKAEVAPAAIDGEKTTVELAQEFDLHAVQLADPQGVAFEARFPAARAFLSAEAGQRVR